MKLTQRQLTVWNSLQSKTFGISANENWNKAQGLPSPEVRQQLKAIHSNLYGICNPTGKVSMAQYKKNEIEKGITQMKQTVQDTGVTIKLK